MVITKIQIMEALKKVITPQTGKDIISEKRIENIKISGNSVDFDVIVFENEGRKKKHIVCTILLIFFTIMTTSFFY